MLPSKPLKALLCLLGATTLALAAPAPPPDDRDIGSHKEPNWYCTWTRSLRYDSYVLEGRYWVKTQKQICNGIKKTGVPVTAWEYKEDALEGFVAKVSCVLIFFFGFVSGLSYVTCMLSVCGTGCSTRLGVISFFLSHVTF